MQVKGGRSTFVFNPLGLPRTIRKTRKCFSRGLPSLSSGTATSAALRVLSGTAGSSMPKILAPLALNIATATPFLHYPLHGHPAPLITMASLMTLALSMGGVIYYGARSAWETLEPWVTGSHLNRLIEPNSIYGIDVTYSRFFNRPLVQKAVEFAAAAHKGQVRKTQEPYVAHCIATAAIVEGLLAPTEDDSRAEAAVITAILHDVLDDAEVEYGDIEREFSPQIASMVQKVSQLSATNQLVRRRLRLAAAEPTQEEATQLRNMILTMVSEPLVIVVKLADRLHNMRTVYALPPEKQKAVAEETRRVWCSLAERLGMFALKSELEDLCFAVLQPAEYRALRAEQDALWGLESIPAPNLSSWDLSSPQITIKKDHGDSSTTSSNLDIKSGGEPGWLGAAHALLPRSSEKEDENSEEDREAAFLTREQLEVRDLVRSVLPFDASTFNMGRLNIPPSARRGLEVLQGCARALLQEITLEGVASGLEVSVQGRVKSLYSSFKKMARKGVPFTQVYDARALRVVVEDDNGTRERESIAACYKLLPAVHRLWRRVDGEDDDYIAQPKGSGYQSLHTAVIGPGGVPMEVQIRTSTMHQVAEYGRAAHWEYKENTPSPLSSGGILERELIARGNPVLQISNGGQLRDGVVIESESDGMRLIVAVSLTGRKYASQYATRASSREYKEILDYVSEEGYFNAGQGDLNVFLELYTLCSDGKYHKLDRFGHKLPTVIVPLSASLNDNAVENGGEQQGDVITGRPNEAIPSSSSSSTLETEHNKTSNGDDAIEDESAYLNNRIRLLRSMLEWGADIQTETQHPAVRTFSSSFAASESSDSEDLHASTHHHHHHHQEQEKTQQPGEVMILLWPTGKIVAVPRGTTAGALARREGGGARRRSSIVNVNNRMVPEGTALADGDFVVLSNEAVKV